MGRVLTMPTTPRQQALARFRMEEGAFRAVLDVLVQWDRNELVLGVFGVYRARLRMLRRLAGGLLDVVEERSPGQELEEFTRRVRRFTPKLRRLTPKRDP